MVYAWVPVRNITERSDQNGASRPSPGSCHTGAAGSAPGTSPKLSDDLEPATPVALGQCDRPGDHLPRSYHASIGSPGDDHSTACSWTRAPAPPPPEKYLSEPGACHTFLTQCKLIFQLQPHTFLSEVSKITYVISQLSGRAKMWGTAVWEEEAPCCQTFQSVETWQRCCTEAATESPGPSFCIG